MRKAKLFTHGDSQCVRLPREFKIADKEVFIQKLGKAVLLVPCNKNWEVFFEGLSGFSDDFMQKDRQQTSQQPEKID